MNFIEFIEDYRGAIQGIALSSGETFSEWKELRDFSQFKQEIFGKDIHKLFIGLKGVGERPRILSSKENGLIVKFKYRNTTFLETSEWGESFSESKVEEIVSRYGKFFSSPAGMVSHSYFERCGKSLPRILRENRPHILEAYLSSSKIPGRAFKPAYGGGLMGSPADRSKVYSGVVSYDVNSSYPWSAIVADVPVTKGIELSRDQLNAVKIQENGDVYVGEKTGFIGLFTLKNFRRKSWVKIPLLRGSDIDLVRDPIVDEIGLVSGASIQVALNPYELKSIKIQYEIESIDIVSMVIHGLGKIPGKAKRFIEESFDKKRVLSKDDPERLAAKTALNTIIGFWGIDPFKSISKTIEIDGDFYRGISGILGPSFDSYAGTEDRMGFSAGKPRAWDFRWAVYVLSHARLRLVEAERMLYEAGCEVLYADTDSIKVSGNRRKVKRIFGKLNKQAQREYDYYGMGQWVDETDGLTDGIFIGIKNYILENPRTGARKAIAAGVDSDVFEESLSGKTMKELSVQDYYPVEISARCSASLADEPFGMKIQYVHRKAVKKYGQTDITFI